MSWRLLLTPRDRHLRIKPVFMQRLSWTVWETYIAWVMGRANKTPRSKHIWNHRPQRFRLEPLRTFCISSNRYDWLNPSWSIFRVKANSVPRGRLERDQVGAGTLSFYSSFIIFWYWLTNLFLQRAEQLKLSMTEAQYKEVQLPFAGNPIW